MSWVRKLSLRLFPDKRPAWVQQQEQDFIAAVKESPNKPSVMRESPQHLIRAAHEPDELFRL